MSSQSADRRPIGGILLGVALGQAAGFSFVAVISLFSLSASLQTGSWTPLRDALELWPAVAIASAPGGAVLGWMAVRVRRRRRTVLLGAATIAYVLASVGVVVHLAPLQDWHDLLELLALGLWGSVAYALYALPGVAAAALLLERWTRPELQREGPSE